MAKSSSRSWFRLLPITIFVAVLMLTAKIGTVWEDFDKILTGAISVADAQAQQNLPAPKPLQPPAAAGKPAAAKPPALPSLEPGPAKAPGQPGGNVQLSAPAQNQGAGGGKPAEADAAEANLLARDPTLLTQAEIDLLQQLADRREVLNARETELDMRSGLMKAAEDRIGKKVQELKILQQTIQKLVKAHDEQQVARMRSLVKIYEAMKPKDAARIFEELELDTLLQVAEQMKERKLAPIMAKMKPAKATEITVQLSRLRELPKPGDVPGG